MPLCLGRVLMPAGPALVFALAAASFVAVVAIVLEEQGHDVVGNYNSFDVFQLTVDRTRQRSVTFRPAETPPSVADKELKGGVEPPTPPR